MKLLMFLIMFLLIGAFFIISQKNIALAKSGNFKKFTTLYFGWFEKIFENGGNIVGHVVKLDWLPG